MLLVPFLVGVAEAGADWRHLPMLAALVVGYFAFFATGLWLRSHGKRRYRAPVLAYGSATAVVGAVVIAIDPLLLGWSVVLGPLLAVSLWFSWRRQERSLANDAVVVIAASLMSVIAAGVGGAPVGPRTWVIAALLALYFGGTVLYVKSMIRNRGDALRYRLSVGYHVVACAPAIAAGLVPGAVFALLAVRAALVPRRWPTATPAALGVGEILASAAVAAALIAS